MADVKGFFVGVALGLVLVAVIFLVVPWIEGFLDIYSAWVEGFFR